MEFAFVVLKDVITLDEPIKAIIISIFLRNVLRFKVWGGNDINEILIKFQVMKLCLFCK